MTSKIIIYFSLFILLNSKLFSFNTTDNEDTLKNTKSLRVYNAERLKEDKPVIDGVLDDICWRTEGEWAGDYTQWIPKEGAKPSQETRLKILYDDKNIYVAIRAYDNEPDKIIRRAGRRDSFIGDIVGIDFDSYHDHRTGFEFNVSAYGQKIDLMLTNPSNADYNWNAVWYVKTGTEDSAWTAEFEIPLSQLRYSSDEEQIWGMHSWRWIDRLQEESDWEPQSSTGPGILYLFGELHGIKGLPKSRRIEIMPYSLGKLNTFKSETGNPFAEKGKDWGGNIGLDAKIGLSSNFTADVTINPDFGQVESDPSVMNLSAFETFYDEKRPFFLEGKNIFSFDFDNTSIFYSRRIGHTPGYSPVLNPGEYMDFPEYTTILGAVKLSGKSADGLSIGVLQSLTAAEHAEIKSQSISRKEAVEPITNFTIARVQQDYEAGNTVLGGILTSTNRFINDAQLNFMNRNAFTGGLDFLHQWNDKEFFIDAKLAGSYINGSTDAINQLQLSSARFYQRPDANRLDESRTSLSGHGGNLKIGKGSKGLWRYSTEINWRSPGLDFNDLGYMQTSDIFKELVKLSYFVNQPVSIFRTFTFGLNQTNNWDYGMNYLSSGGGFSVYLEFLNNWAINSSINYTTEALDTRILRGGSAMLVPAAWSFDNYFKTDPSGKIYFDISSNVSWSQNNSSNSYSIEPGISVIPVNTLKLSASFNYSSNIDNLQYITTESTAGNPEYILGKINQRTLGVVFRVDYNITPEISIQFYGSPYASIGKYSEFKTVTNPKADDYNNRFSNLNPVLVGNAYIFPESSSTDNSFFNPDFNFSQFRSNLVFRWEYLPGSQVYLVWSNERTNYVQPGEGSIFHAVKILKDIYPKSIFLVKFNYWFTI